MSEKLKTDVCEDWEQMIENGSLERTLEQLRLKTTSSEASTKPAKVRLEDPCTRTQYTPMVKILKRDSKPKQEEEVKAQPTSAAPVKTLAQREEEYARARARILGTAKAAEQNREISKMDPSTRLSRGKDSDKRGMS